MGLGETGTVLGCEGLVGKNPGVETGLAEKGLLDGADLFYFVKLFKKIIIILVIIVFDVFYILFFNKVNETKSKMGIKIIQEF